MCRKFNKLFVFLLVVAFSFWRARYGFASTDETYAIAFPYRLLFGDALIADEWGLQQFAGLLVYPLVSLYVKVFQSTDGIMLFFRYVFAVVMMAVGLFQYCRWRRVHEFGAYCGLLFFVAYAPFGIMTLAYNTMDVIFGSLTVTLYATYDRKSFWPMFFAGMTFVAVSMCCPLLPLGYGAYTLYALCSKERRREWVSVTCGASVAGLAVLAFVFSRASLDDVQTAIPLMLEDPEHPLHSLPYLCYRWFKCAVAQQKIWSMICYLTTGVGVMCYLVKLRLRSRTVRFPPSAFFTVMLVVSVALAVFLTHVPNQDYLIFPVCAMLFLCALSLRNATLRADIIRTLIPAYALGFFTLMGCNTGYVRISIVMACVIVPTLAYWMKMAQDESVAMPRWSRLCVLCVVIVLVGANVFFRYRYVFSDVPIPRMDVWVSQGPEKGLKTISGLDARYDEEVATIKAILSREKPGKVCFLHANTTAYLIAQKPYGAYTAWVTSSGHDSFRRLEKYFALHPDRLPDIVHFVRADEDQKSDFSKLGYVDGDPVPYGSYMRRKVSFPETGGVKGGK